MTAKLARKLLLVGVSAAALAVSAAEAGAKIFLFTGSVQTYLVPETGEYEITVAGAQGGSSSDGNAGGMGAIVGGDIFLRQNELLGIFVGGAGYSLPGYAGGAAAALSWVIVTGSFSSQAGAAAAVTETGPSLTGALAALREAAATGGAAPAAMADRVGMAAKAAKTQPASMAAAAAA